MFFSILFQEPGSLGILALSSFHDVCIELLLFVMCFVLFFLVLCCSYWKVNSFFNDSHFIEFFWTILPAALVVLLAVPSVFSLYFLDEKVGVGVFDVSVVGKQWFWEFNHSGSAPFDFGSYGVGFDSGSGFFRTLEVDSVLTVPLGEVGFLVSSGDVIHSFSVPALGVKVDATPGKVSQVEVSVALPGVFYGACSEICGVNHSFMPVCVYSSFLFQGLNMGSVLPEDLCLDEWIDWLPDEEDIQSELDYMEARFECSFDSMCFDPIFKAADAFFNYWDLSIRFEEASRAYHSSLPFFNAAADALKFPPF